MCPLLCNSSTNTPVLVVTRCNSIAPRLRNRTMLRYTLRKSSPSREAGCGSPMQFPANSRKRTYCGFFVNALVLAALMGGLWSCRFSLRELPGLPHPSALPPNVEVGRQSSNATLEAIHG